MRDLFMLDPEVTFLNHGSFGACPRCVFERYQAWQRELENQPVLFLGRRYENLYQEARDALGDYLGTAGENLIFVNNATSGINTVGRSLKLEPGDEILTTNHEYGALNLMWRYLEREKGIRIVVQELPLPLNDPEAVIEALWAGITDKTRVIYLSHITSPTALILPVQAICHRAREADILTIVDGAHAPGQLDLGLDAIGADFYSGNCHKWMMTPKGSAFLYVRPEHHAIIDPLVISWGWDGETMYDHTAWQGTRDPSAFLTIPEAIQFMAEHDWQQVQERCHDLAIETMQRICDLVQKAPIATPEFFGQLVAAPLPDDIDPIALKAQLYDQFKVEVPIIDHPSGYYVRVSFQAYNTREDADKLIEALRCLL